MIRAILLTCLSFITLQFIHAQPAGLPVFVRDSLDQYVHRALRNWQIPGVAVGIVKNGELVVAKGYGVLEKGKQEKVDAHTLFMIGSNTKAFTGTALAMLAAEGKCSLDDRIKKWLPAFDMKDDWVEQHVTFKDLVSHRLGMETFQGDFTYWGSNLTDLQVMEKFGRFMPMYDFRTKWGYCNAGFLVAGMAMEPVSGKTWPVVLRERIFKPLKMNRTLALSSEVANATNMARAHTIHEGKLIGVPYGKIDNLAPAGSISSSIHDMSHWVIANLNGGKYEDREVIPEAAIQMAMEPLSIMGRAHHPFNSSHYELYGMGWMLQDYEGTEIVSHTGGVNGFVTSVTLLPEERLGIMVFTNTDQNAFYETLKWEIIDAFLELPYRNYSDVYLMGYQQQHAMLQENLQKLRDTVAMRPAPAIPIDKFAGHYENEMYGGLDMKSSGGNLTVTFEHHPNLKAKLEPLGDRRFLCTYSDPVYGVRTVWFDMQDNQVKSFTLRVAQFVEFTTYEFFKKE